MHRRPFQSPSVATALLLVVLSAAVVKSPAQLQSRACNVWFEIGYERLANYLGPEAADEQVCINRDITESLHRKFHYWEFQGGTNNSVPRVEVILEKSTALNIRVRLVSRTGDSDEDWADELIPPGESQLTGTPGPAATNLCADVRKAFAKLLDDSPKNRKIKLFLEKNVPLHCAMDPPRALLITTATAALPLDWGIYHDLCASVFTIECRAPNNEIITLRSKGTGRCMTMTFPGETQPLRCIVVSHNEWVSAAGTSPFSSHDRSEIDGLSLKKILLKEEDDDVESSSDCELRTTVAR